MFPQLAPVFASLKEREVRYVVIGGVAAIYYGVNRLTNDLDLLIDPTKDNAENLLAGLEAAQFGTAALVTVDELLKTDITILKDRIRIDIFTKTPGISFSDAWSRREVFFYEAVPVNIVSRDDLVAAKRAAGRKVDLEDVARLEQKS